MISPHSFKTSLLCKFKSSGKPSDSLQAQVLKPDAGMFALPVVLSLSTTNLPAIRKVFALLQGTVLYFCGWCGNRHNIRGSYPSFPLDRDFQGGKVLAVDVITSSIRVIHHSSLSLEMSLNPTSDTFPDQLHSTHPTSA